MPSENDTMMNTMPKGTIILLLLISCVSFNSLSAQYDVNENKWFTDLEDALSEPDRVYKLDLSGQDLDKIPSELELFPNLDGLKLMNNHISEIGAELSENTRLEYLDLTGNQLQEIDFSVLSNSALNLTRLILRENLLENIDASINKLKFLSYLDLGGNFIETIDNEVNLRYLKYLGLDNNSLAEVPAVISNSKKLKSLNLNANSIEIFEIRVLESLTALDLGDNPLKKFNITISKLEKLILDWVDFNELELYPLPVSMEILSMEHCNLEAIPDFVFKMYKLEELSIMHNKITTINPEIANCNKLELLWIQGNDIEQPAEGAFDFTIKK